jgi:hypothetical protein
VKSGYLTILKAVCMTDHTDSTEVLKTETVNDIRGNINMGILKIFSMQNTKGMTPLITAVET